MADGNIDRVTSQLGSQGDAYNLTPIHHLRIAGWAITRLFMAATEAGFSTTNRRCIQKQPQVTGKPEAAGVGNSLPINQDKVRGNTKSLASR
jgi:hypothetical protein